MLATITGTGNGSAPVVNITFPYIDKSHVKASVNGTSVAFQWTGTSQITLSSAAPSGYAWKVYRETPTNPALVNFTDSSVITEADLDMAETSHRYRDEELADLLTLEATAREQDMTDAVDSEAAIRAAADATETAARKADVAAIMSALSGVSLTDASLPAADRVILAALDHSANPSAILMEAGRAGVFAWSAIDHSADVSADPEQGIYVAPSADATGASGAWVRVGHNQVLDPRWFGATGVGAEQVSNVTPYQTDVSSDPITISQQTVDGKAINAALRLLRRWGGGTLDLGAGKFTTYGYLERIDFPVRIVGAGRDVTVLRNVAASPWTHGYGILVIHPASLTAVSLSSLTLDGNGPNRTGSGEVRAYNIAVYGLPQLTLNDIETRNAIIDTFMTAYENGDTGAYVKATNSVFSNSYRNTVSLVAGWNQQFTNCTLEKGGQVNGGTNPRAVLDIEPNGPSNDQTIKNITFENCTFRDAKGSLAYGVWAGNIQFNGCTFHATGGDGSTGANAVILPYLCDMRGGQFHFRNCNFQGDGSFRSGIIVGNDVTTGEYATSQFTSFESCTIDGGGFLGFGVMQKFKNVEVRNSYIPFLVMGNGSQDIEADGLTLTNVFDAYNQGGGVWSSFNMPNTFEGTRTEVSNLMVKVDAGSMPTGFLSGLTALPLSVQYGIYLGGSGTHKARFSNVHVKGYYRQLPTALGQPLNAGLFRDWNSPNLAPADSTGDTNAVGFYYRDCTMYGDAA